MKGSSLVLSPIIPHSTSSSIIHILLFSSMNWLLVALHCMHCHPAIDSFPRAIAWKAKLPIRYMSMMCELMEQFCLNSHSNSNNPSLFNSMWRCHFATISRPLVSCLRIVLWINLPVSFRQINSQTVTSNSIILSPIKSTDTDAPNWKAVSPWSPPTTTWTRFTSDGVIDLLFKCRCK